ncbi:MAG TPA: sensor histidine kinase [Methyloceanibacter sp.]|nr:sensor histidine kinase [Methyloceanibacter sp.]
MLQKLWYDRPVRTQLLVAVGIINLLAALFAGAVSIMNTRAATKVEIEASLEVAQRFVAATIKDLSAREQLTPLNQELPLELKHLRHVRIMFMDSMGQLTVISPQPANGVAGTANVPRWFAALVRPQLAGRAVKVVALEGVNPVIIVGEPGDEIAEAWQDFSSLALVWLVLNALILAVLYVVLGRMLNPLGHLSKGMLNLEDGHYATRLPLPKIKELAGITERFNTLAGALDMARDENSRLYRQLISVQEEERRAIANELHDEAGPCLFGITANASSIQNLAEQRPNRRSTEISRRVGEILSIAERLKLLNRALLKKLRPGPLGRVKLAELLDELIASFQRRHPDTHISVSFGDLAESYGEAVDLTLYRCVQEGITNAIRHGNAETLTVRLAAIPESRRGKRGRANLRLSLIDNGKGIAPATPKGFGLTAMTERVRSLGGSCVIESTPRKGTNIHVEIPVERTAGPVRRASASTKRPGAAAKRAAELVEGL